ncbi:thioredoxin-like protein [Polyplosphaeria fusca]|uniref:Thioredoxin-like protein n=1 Tax=Polyplosphaeria fusca TaxID=682080 RepID=A0A9P4QW45_9PLEO|nr:thioredoxin-like protein [Polyplosphaeria fusca]
MTPPVLEFNYDISCPFAYIASTRVEALAERTGVTLKWRPVLLGAIYRSTSAPQGPSGSASDVFNPTKRAVTARSMARTLRRHNITYKPPPRHPLKTVNALRLLHSLDDSARPELTKRLFRAYWVEGRDVSDDDVLLAIVREAGIDSVRASAFSDADARRALESATSDAIERGAFGVPSFWVPGARWTDFSGEERVGRFFWGQDRMGFVEAALLAMRTGGEWEGVSGLGGLLTRCVGGNEVKGKVRVEFWYDFSSPWAFLGWAQLRRLERVFRGELEVVRKPFLLGILFREIGAPNLPMAAVSQQKALWSRQDHADWTHFLNARNKQEGSPEKNIDFHWADIFPIRTPTVLRCAIVEPDCAELLYRACWEQNADVADEAVLIDVLNKGAFDGKDLVKKANAPAAKNKLRELTAEAKAVGICGVPSYRVFRQADSGEWKDVSGIIWGQDEQNVVEDYIAGWDDGIEDEKVKTKL